MSRNRVEHVAHAAGGAILVTGLFLTAISVVVAFGDDVPVNITWDAVPDHPISWEPVSGATEYEIAVYSVSEDREQVYGPYTGAQVCDGESAEGEVRCVVRIDDSFPGGLYEFALRVKVDDQWGEWVRSATQGSGVTWRLLVPPRTCASVPPTLSCKPRRVPAMAETGPDWTQRLTTGGYERSRVQ